MPRLRWGSRQQHSKRATMKWNITFSFILLRDLCTITQLEFFISLTSTTLADELHHLVYSTVLAIALTSSPFPSRGCSLSQSGCTIHSSAHLLSFSLHLSMPVRDTNSSNRYSPIPLASLFMRLPWLIQSITPRTCSRLSTTHSDELHHSLTCLTTNRVFPSATCQGLLLCRRAESPVRAHPSLQSC